MFVGWRDLRFARGRFLLLGAVVALITLLVGFLTGLTAGLADQNIAAVTALSADRIAFSLPKDGSAPTYAASEVTQADVDAWSEQPGVSAVQPLGIVVSRIEADGFQQSVTAFGGTGYDGQTPAAGQALLSETIAEDIRVDVGGAVELAGVPFTVQAVVPDSWYSHMPVVYLDLDGWRSVAKASGNPDAFATVLLVSGDDIDADSADAVTGMHSTSVLGSLLLLPAFRSEIGSLVLITAMLFGISALVVGAFFTVWSMQRQPDVAVLKALGASTKTVVLDALGQAALVLVVGVGVGIGVVALLGLAVGGALPFVLNWLTTVVPAVLLIVLGLAGAGFALRPVTKVDPLTALGGNR